ncbi:hypothetical protein [uncultured Ruminococcus sp.]|uniref:hypothetical protein n=1 Tax=uncultured Ruminococcus sp. TaxID=165186 RepID=UPI0026253CFC|nr:hypothetical protein [uncultured Ruminococcus sp.]
MDYKTMAEIVKSRGDRILEERRVRRIRIRRITSGVAAMCAALIIGFGIWHSNTAGDPSSVNFNGETTATAAENTTEAATVTSDSNYTVTTKAVTSASAAATVTAVTANTVSAASAAATAARPVQTVRVSAQAAVTTTAHKNISTKPVVTVTTTTPTEVITETHRRVYYMNKLTAGFAAMLVASAAAPKPVGAVNDTGMRPVPFELMSVQYDINDFDFGKWRNDEGIIDINGDEKFDVSDIYSLYCLSCGDDAAVAEGVRTDLNNDGVFDEYDVNQLVYYYTCYNKVERDILDTKKYGKDFVDYFIEKTEAFHGLYDIFADTLAEKKPDLDVDGNGSFDMGDLMDIYIFHKLFNEPSVVYEDMDPEALSYAEKLKVYNELTTYKFPSDSEAKCLDLFSTIGDDSIVAPIFADYLIRYYLANNEFKPEYSDPTYYEVLRDTRYDERITYSARYKDAFQSFQNAVENTEWEMGLPSSDVRANVDMTNIDAEYAVYKQKVQAGLLPEPDLNLDGRVTFVDHQACDDIFNGCRYYPDGRYSREMIDNFLINFDLNENGISGDAADCSIAQIYICEKLGVKTKKEKEYEDFRTAWINGEVSNYPWPGTNCLDGTRYPLTDPDDLFSLCYNYVFAFTYSSSEVRQMKYENYYVNVEAGTVPAPDVDMNGVIDANDYIFAENTLYSQTHTSENINTVPDAIMDNYIANFDLDGSGVSGDAMDTTLILEYVSRKCGIDTADLETMAWNARGQYAETPVESVGTTAGPFANNIVTTTTTATALSEKTGDANCDSDLDLSDAILVMQALANPDKYEVKGTSKNHITSQGKKNADVDKSTAGLTANDALCIQNYLVGNSKTLA